MNLNLFIYLRIFSPLHGLSHCQLLTLRSKVIDNRNFRVIGSHLDPNYFVSTILWYQSIADEVPKIALEEFLSAHYLFENNLEKDCPEKN